MSTQVVVEEQPISPQEVEQLMAVGKIVRLLDASNKLAAQIKEVRAIIRNTREFSEYKAASLTYRDAVEKKCSEERAKLSEARKVLAQNPEYQKARELSKKRATFEKEAHSLASQTVAFVENTFFKGQAPPL